MIKYPKLKVLSVITILTILFLIGSRQSVQAMILFQDNFESQSLSNWQIINGSWTFQTDLQNNHWLTNTTTNSDSEIQTGDLNWNDYKFSLDLLSIIGVDKNIFFRITGQRSSGLPNHSLPVGYGLHIVGKLVELQKW